MTAPLNVLSLFDGVSTGRLCLDLAGVPVRAYYASEIDADAIKISKSHYPDVRQLGDVRNIRPGGAGEPSLLMGGSPCVDLSITKSRDRKGLAGDASGLFWEFVRIKDALNPTWFFFENVPMSKEWENQISEALGVRPIVVDSAHFSPSSRERLYWTNIPRVPLPPKDTRVLADVLEPSDAVPAKYWYDGADFTLTGKSPVAAILHVNGHEILKRVYDPQAKAPTLTTVSGGYQQKKVLQDGRVRKLMPVEYERLMGLPDSWTEGVSDTARYSACGNGWSVDVVKWFFTGLL